MPGADSSGIISASSLAKGTGQRAAYGQGLQNANMPKPTHGREKLRSQVEADAKTTQPVASVMQVGSKATDAGWSIYRSNLGTPSRSAHGPNYSACRQRSHGYLRQSVRTAWEQKRSFRTGGGGDQMRARRRRWQIRVRAGTTCEVRWHAISLNRVAHSNEPAAGFTLSTRVTPLRNESA